jgi:hypothetical protein
MCSRLIQRVIDLVILSMPCAGLESLGSGRDRGVAHGLGVKRLTEVRSGAGVTGFPDDPWWTSVGHAGAVV